MATYWLEFVSVLRLKTVHPHGVLWEQVEGKMTCALLLLRRAFPLNECLNGHPFSQFVQRLHYSVHNRKTERRLCDLTATVQPCAKGVTRA
ncbi:hypothetical protein ABBQ32_007525 [Trebouxia sp. C0010 RCD-2024]